MTKQNILTGSAIATALSFLWEYVGNVKLCKMGGLNSDCWDILHDAELVVLPIVTFLFLLSLITYKMREEVFRAWWNFARWMLPIIILATVLVNLMPSNHGFFNMDALAYLLVLAPLYAILILVSLWIIVHKYRELKHEGK